MGGRGGGAPTPTLELPPSGLGAATWLDRRPAPESGGGGGGGNPWTQPIVTEHIINDGVAYAGGGGGGGGGSSPWTQPIITEHISNEGAAYGGGGGGGGGGIASGAKRASGGFNNVWSKGGDGGGGDGGSGGGGWRTQGQTEPKAGMVIVRVLRATDLVAADLSGKSDPYVKLKASGKKAKTSVVKATLNPEWNETLELRVDDLSQPISLEVRGSLMTR